MQPQPRNDEHAYLALAGLSARIDGLLKLLEAFSLHIEQYPMLYVNGEAWKWIEEGNRLIADAEKVLKEEGRKR